MGYHSTWPRVKEEKEEEEGEEARIRLLDKKDFKKRGIATEGEWNAFDALMIVAQVAAEVLEEEKNMKKDGEVESSKRDKSLKDIMDVSKQERLAREKPITYPADLDLDLHNNKKEKDKCVVREKLLSSAMKKDGEVESSKRHKSSKDIMDVSKQERPITYPADLDLDLNNNKKEKDRCVLREKILSSAMKSDGKLKKESEEKEEDGLELKKRKTGLKRKCVDSEDDYEWGLEFQPKTRSNFFGRKKKSEPGPPMPQNMKDLIIRMNGTGMMFVIQKILSKTDTTSNHNRLLIPWNQIVDDVLTPGEADLLDRGFEMQTPIIEPSLKISKEIIFKQWEMKKAKGKSNFNYVLRTGWKHVVGRNGLKENDIVQVWSFRVERELWFALFRVSDGVDSASGSQTIEDNNNGSGSTGVENGASTVQNGVGVQGGDGVDSASGSQTTEDNNNGSDSSGGENGASTAQSGVGVQGGNGGTGDGSVVSTMSPSGEAEHSGSGRGSNASCNGSIGNGSDGSGDCVVTSQSGDMESTPQD